MISPTDRGVRLLKEELASAKHDAEFWKTAHDKLRNIVNGPSGIKGLLNVNADEEIVPALKKLIRTRPTTKRKP